MKILICAIATMIQMGAVILLLLISYDGCWNKKSKEMIIPADVINACLNSGGKLQATSNGCKTKFKCIKEKGV